MSSPIVESFATMEHVKQPSLALNNDEEAADTPSTAAANSPRQDDAFAVDEEEEDDISDQSGSPPPRVATPDCATFPPCVTTPACETGDTPAAVSSDLKSRTVIIFDWDDTILPTTTLRNCSRPTSPSLTPGLGWGVILDAPELDQDLLAQFEELSSLCAETIELTSRFGEVCFITNGSLDWIRTSCQKYMPSLWPTVCHIKRVSAKDLVQTQSRDPLQWKKQTFCMQLNQTFQQPAHHLPKVVVSIGDSLHERHALYHFFNTTPVDNVSIRSIKFVSLPDVPKLIAQHLALREHFPAIANISPKCRCADLRYHFLPGGDGDSSKSIDALDEDAYEDDLLPTFVEPDFVSETAVNEAAARVVANIEAVVFPLVRTCGGVLPPPPVRLAAVVPPDLRTGDAVSVSAPVAGKNDSMSDNNNDDEHAPLATPAPEFTIPCKLSRLEEDPETAAAAADSTCSSSSDDTSSSGAATTTTTSAESDKSPQSVMSSFFNRASLSISRILGRGSNTSAVSRPDMDASNPFALTPSAKVAAARLPLTNSVKLSSGNPGLFAHVAGFRFEWQYSPEIEQPPQQDEEQDLLKVAAKAQQLNDAEQQPEQQCAMLDDA
eukprot:Gregarina_sp_Pseudo_9__4917@NODE_514_length_2664_cov_17_519619_g485_i0_p1_GENE_NODE_514_length_2664_cov_17_519619_g485_i0NODE_514_length_2664_cov_17_519619_g485_i0_p1_ORF_typecomplete_len606_score163_73_NODE_514_length_2664_cov_17_519619_g485_i07922609